MARDCKGSALSLGCWVIGKEDPLIRRVRSGFDTIVVERRRQPGVRRRLPDVFARLKKPPQPTQTQTWDRIVLRHGGGYPQVDLRTRAGPAPDVVRPWILRGPKLISNSTPTVDFSDAAARADVLFVLLRHPRTRTSDDEFAVAGRGQCQAGTGLRAVMDCSQLHDLGRQTRQPQEFFIG